MKTVLDHVAFLVRSLDAARADLPGLTAGEVREFPGEGTREQYLGHGGARILLLEAMGDGPYRDALERRGPGLHHVALRVRDLDEFLDSVVDGSGWFLHPRSFRTRREAATVWLTRPNVEVLVELTQDCELEQTARCVDRVEIAGLDLRTGLAAIFEGCGVPVEPGPASSVILDERRIWSPGEELARAKPDAFQYNREAWDAQVRAGNRWTVPVDADEVQRARDGAVEVLLTPTKPVPPDWLGALNGRDVLCLASGGGQQGPLLAAAGANVTVFDASDAQLDRDRTVAEREGLELRTVQGDMRDLSAFDDASFDLVFHPCSNVFVEEIAPVWAEAFRVLRPAGELLSGFTNPILSCFDWGSIERGTPRLRFALPYRDVDHLDVPFVARVHAAGEPLEFGHTLTAQLAGQTAAGFHIVDMFEDRWGSGELFPDAYFDGFIATRAWKP